MWIKTLLIVVLLGTLGLLSAIWFGSILWNRATTRLINQLTLPPDKEAKSVVSLQELDNLPVPVNRYFHHVLRDGQPIIQSVKLTQEGGFRARPSDNKWSEMKAIQYFSTEKRGFVWDARIQMAPLMAVRIRDSYVNGQGAMKGKLLSVVPVVDEQGKSELSAGALQRYLAEAVWFPTALLPSQGVKWSEIDESRALATLTDSGITVSLEFRFNSEGEIMSVLTPERYREANGKYELTPWAGYYHDYEEKHGMHIPTTAKVEWQLADGNFPYWQARIIEIDYEFVH